MPRSVKVDVRAFSMMEILIVIIIVGILAAMALPNMLKMKEKSFDNEAKASLKLIQAAEKIYYMQNSFYYPHASSGVTPNNTLLNSALKVYLPVAGTPTWSYTSTSAGNAQATRSIAGGRSWSLPIGNESPTCANGGSDTCIP